MACATGVLGYFNAWQVKDLWVLDLPLLVPIPLDDQTLIIFLEFLLESLVLDVAGLAHVIFGNILVVIGCLRRTVGPQILGSIAQIPG